MKNFALTFAAATSAMTMLSAMPAAAQTCSAAPSCDTLGYNQTAAYCAGKGLSYIKCPFDQNKVFCGTPPAATVQPHVGDLKYSLYSSNHSGWLLCNGAQYPKTSYPTLFNLLGTSYCSTRGGCSSGYFAVPDYRGFFLRGYSSPASLTSTYYAFSGSWNYSTTTPQKEQLPNITGNFYTGRSQAVTLNSWMGAFSKTAQSGYWANREASSDGGKYEFNASKSNAIYNGSHVIPANYGAYIFIYSQP